MFSLGRWASSIEFVEGPQRETANPYDRDETEHVRLARIRGPWHPKMAGYLEKKGVKGLAFSFRGGFRGGDYGFFDELGFIELFTLPRPERDIEMGDIPVARLTGLRRLVAPDKVLSPVSLDALPRLESCTMQWQPKLGSVFDTRGLKRLQIRSLAWQKAERLAGLTTLENLEIAHSGIRSFAPIGALTGLRRLSLSVCHGLDDLDGIEELQGLRCLHLEETPKITLLERIAALPDLEVLTIADGREIASVAPLQHLKNLKALWIAGRNAKIVDGDLSALTELPNLAMLTLRPHRHYSHRAIKAWDWGNLDRPDQQLEPV